MLTGKPDEAAILESREGEAEVDPALMDVADKPPTTLKYSLEALKNTSALNDPQILREMEARALANNAAIIGNQNSYDTSQTIAQTYQKVFAADPTAVWFGFAPYAVAKVGQTYLDVDGTAAGLIDPQNAAIVKQGFFEGNKAIFNSMLTAEQVYQAGGAAAVRAMRNQGIEFGGENKTRDERFENSLIQSFEQRDLAKSMLAAGNTAGAKVALTKSLVKSAEFEQAVVLQQYYDQKYDARSANGNTTQQSLRGAISGFRDSAVAVATLSIADQIGVPQVAANVERSYIEDKTRVSVLGVSSEGSTFKGSDIGDLSKRLAFVNSAAQDFMARYGQTFNNGNTWDQVIIRDQNRILTRVYPITAPPVTIPVKPIFNRT